MANKPFNSVDGLSVGNTPIDVVYANGDVSASNLVVSGTSNLGPVSNVLITGGTTGQVLSTDGAGNLSFVNIASNSAAIMPYLITSTESYVVPENFQGLFAEPIDIEGEFAVDGILIDVGGGSNGGGGGTATALDASISNVSISGGTNGYVLSTNGSGSLSWVAQSGGGGNGVPGGSNTQIQYNNAGVFAGNSTFTFASGTVSTPNLSVTGNSLLNGKVNVTGNTTITGTMEVTGDTTLTGTVNLTGNIVPTTNVAYSLGNNTNRFNDLYLAGTTISLGESTFSANSTAVIITNPLGGRFVMAGNANTSTSVLANGNSNITVANNSSIGITANGVSNVMLITKDGVDITGTLGTTGNITSLGDITALGDLSGADITSTGNVSVTGNISAANLSITGSFEATGNLSGININTSGDLGVIGNGNIQTNLYVGVNAVVASKLTVGNPVAPTDRADIYSNGYAYLRKLDVSNGNITGNNLSLTSNLTVNNYASIGNLQVSSVNSLGNIVANNITSNGVVIATGNLTAANASLGNLVVANFFQGDGRYLSNITVEGGTSIVNGNSNVIVTPNSNVNFSVAGVSNVLTVTSTNTYFNTDIISNGNVVTDVVKSGAVSITLDNLSTWIAFDAGNGNVLEIHDTYIAVTGTSNLTGNVAVTGKLDVTGNTTVGNLTASKGTVTGNLSAGNITTGNITAGNISGGNLVSANFLSGDGYLISNLTISSGTSLINGNSNVNVALDANVTITAEGNANVVTVTGNSIIFSKQISSPLATLTTINAGTINATTVNANSSLTIDGNITANGYANVDTLRVRQVAGNLGTATIEGNLRAQANLFVSGYSNVGLVNAGYINVSDSIDANNTVHGNFVTATFDITASRNLIVDYNISAGGNLSITGNSTLRKTNVIGNLTASNIDGGNLISANFLAGDGYLISNLTVPAGTALLNGTSNLYVDGSGNIRLSVAGISNIVEVSNVGAVIDGTLVATGNANLNNISTGRILATGNITTSAVISNGNISGTNVSATGNMSASGNISTSGTITASGNLTAANANLGNRVAANFFVGDGYLLSNLTIPTGTAIINGGSNVLVTANSNVNITINGTANVAQFTEGGMIVNGDIVATGSINGGSFANGSSNITIANNGAVGISINGTDSVFNVLTTGIYANAKIFALAGLSVTGNANIGNLGVSGIITTPGSLSAGELTTSGDLSVAGNANVATARVTGALTTIGNITGGNITTSGLMTAGTANINGNTTINGNLGVTGNFTVTGNLNYQNVTDLVVGDPLIYIGNDNTGDLVDLGFIVSFDDGLYQHGGIARDHTDGVWKFFSNVVAEPTTVIDFANAQYDDVKMGNLTSTGNANISGNISANYVFANIVGNISGNISVGTNTQVLFNDNGVIAGNAGFTFNRATGAFDLAGNGTFGNVNGGNLVNANYVAGVLTTAAQPNITSTGTLSNLTSNGTINFTGASNVSLGSVSNVKISGGSANYVLSTDGAGNLSWAAQTGGGGGGNGGLAANVFFENSLVVSSNYTITTGKSAMSTGPITISDGVVVTIPAGSKWVIL